MELADLWGDYDSRADDADSERIPELVDAVKRGLRDSYWSPSFVYVDDDRVVRVAMELPTSLAERGGYVICLDSGETRWVPRHS